MLTRNQLNEMTRSELLDQIERLQNLGPYTAELVIGEEAPELEVLRQAAAATATRIMDEQPTPEETGILAQAVRDLAVAHAALFPMPLPAIT